MSDGSTDMEFVSTGRAAKLLSVAPDTVLRWVKQGKLSARKTAGGHYRVSLARLEAFLGSKTRYPSAATETERETFQPCWEYHSEAGRIRESCRSCAVYLARDRKCYEAREQPGEIERSASYCPTACEECSRYKEQKRRTINILVITDNKALKESLLEEGVFSRLNLRFTNCGYECSAIVDAFRPEYVVMDCAMKPQKRQELCEHLWNDSRIPGIKIILAVSANRSLDADASGSVSVTGQLFTLTDLENYVEHFQSLWELPKGGKEIMSSKGGQIASLNLDENGFLSQLGEWNSGAAEALARTISIWPLTDDHWKIIEFVHKYYGDHQVGPPVVRISKATGLDMKRICELFPCGVVKGAYRIAGLPRPPGCA
jgi:tRNA 2-thiouridine synthesizing protein E